MWSWNSRRLTAALWLCASVLPVSAGASDELESSLRDAIRGGEYVPAREGQIERAEAFFLRLARGASPAEVAAEAKELAMEVRASASLVIVREADQARHGRGFFVFRREARPDALLIPHGFKDAMTRDIGVRLFAEGSFSAAAWNTVPRGYERGNQRIDADMAHLPNTWFNAFTRAVARAWPQGRTVQLHGFEPAKRKNAAAAQADMIVSNGTRTPDPSLRQQHRCLRETFGKVLLYPDDVRELGGTTNAQAITLRAIGYGGFVHMEASRVLRQRLQDDLAARTALLRCVQP